MYDLMNTLAKKLVYIWIVADHHHHIVDASIVVSINLICCIDIRILISNLTAQLNRIDYGPVGGSEHYVSIQFGTV